MIDDRPTKILPKCTFSRSFWGQRRTQSITTTTYSQTNERSMKKKVFNIRATGIYRWLVSSRVHCHDRLQTKGENIQCLLLEGLSEGDQQKGRSYATVDVQSLATCWLERIANTHCLSSFPSQHPSERKCTDWKIPSSDQPYPHYPPRANRWDWDMLEDSSPLPNVSVSAFSALASSLRLSSKPLPSSWLNGQRQEKNRPLILTCSYLVYLTDDLSPNPYFPICSYVLRSFCSLSLKTPILRFERYVNVHWTTNASRVLQ